MVHWLIKLFQRKKRKCQDRKLFCFSFFFLFFFSNWMNKKCSRDAMDKFSLRFLGGVAPVATHERCARGSRRLRGAPHGPVVLTSYFCQHQLSSVAVGTHKVKGGSVHMWQGHTHGLHACCDKQGWTVVTRSGHRQEHKLVLDQLTCA